MTNKILVNQNKIIGKLPNNIFFNNFKSDYIKQCSGMISLQSKLKLTEPIYLHLNTEHIIQTFLYLFNNNEGKGIFINIIKSKIKHFILFNNEKKTNFNKYDIIISKTLEKILTKIIKTNTFNLMFFVNLSKYPVLNKKINNNSIPIVSFNTSYKHNDICLPLPIEYKPKTNIRSYGILFIFESDKINKASKSNEIYKKILELKHHPYYQNHNIDYVIIENCEESSLNKIKLLSTIVIILDPYIPFYYQYFIKNKINIVLIENNNHYSYYSKLLNPNIEYISWSINEWINYLDNYTENKKIANNLIKWSEKNVTKTNITNIFLGFLEHLNQIFVKSNVIVQPYTNNKFNSQLTLQLDYNKFYNLLQKNYKIINYWSYKLNPYSRLLNLLRTNHTFIPEYIKLSKKLFFNYNNLHWITNKRSNINFLPKLLAKNELKNTYEYIINNIDDLLSINIINDTSSIFYIEIPEPKREFNLLENDFIDKFDYVLQFINSKPTNSVFIIRIYTFTLVKTINLLNQFQNSFEQIFLIKNNWFDPFLPYRYLVGVNRVSDSSKITNKVKIDFATYNNIFFQKESLELIKIIKYCRSNAIVNDNNSDEIINKWITKWITEKDLIK